MERRNVIFLSYSREDAKVLVEFKKHLMAALPRGSELELFSDYDIEAGQDWMDVIQEKVARTVVGVFLVSVDLVNSDIVRDVELRPLLEAQEQDIAHAVSLFVRPANTEPLRLEIRTKEGRSKIVTLDAYQAPSRQNRPDKTLSQLSSDAEREAVLVDAAKNVVSLAMRQLKHQESHAARSVGSDASKAGLGSGTSDERPRSHEPVTSRPKRGLPALAWVAGVVSVALLTVAVVALGADMWGRDGGDEVSRTPPEGASPAGDGAEPVHPPVNDAGSPASGDESKDKPEPRPEPKRSLLDMVAIPPGAMPGEDPLGVGIAAFEISPREITRGEWLALGLEVPEPQYWRELDDTDLPANNLNWFDAIRFCNALSAREGLTPRYYEDEACTKPWTRQVDREEKDGETAVFMKGDAEGYRLPTEREWEYAARAGTATWFYWGSDDAKDYAWFDDNAGGSVRPVGQKLPNDWGLRDVAGNVWEWCEDWHDDDRDGRALRGGSFDGPAVVLASSFRLWYWPAGRYRCNGFRVVRPSLPQHGAGR